MVSHLDSTGIQDCCDETVLSLVSIVFKEIKQILAGESKRF